MNITRERFVVMRNNRSEIWCGLSKNFYFKPISEIKDTSVKTYRSQAQAEAGCSSWDRNFEVVPATETIVIGQKTNADKFRAMTDEELVNVVPCPLGFSMFRCPINRQCGDCKREWLQQPAEKDDADG